MVDSVTPVTPGVTGIVTPQNSNSESPVTGVTYIKEISKKREALVCELIRSYIDSYVHIPEIGVTAVTLWVLSTYFESKFDVTGYLHVVSPEKQSGKTTLLDVTGTIVARPLPTAHISAAGLRKVLDEQPPYTLLFDEIDQVFQRKNEDTADLRAVINAGYIRGAQVLINEHYGKTWKLQAYQVYGPKVLAGIGLLPDTIESRCIPIWLERMPRSVTKLKFRIRKAREISEQIKLVISTLEPPEQFPEPKIPEALNGRQSDIWEPLLAIADWVGGEWPSKARLAATTLCGHHEDDTETVALLRDIRELFDEKSTAGMYSVDLAALLVEREDWPYQHMFNGLPLDPARLAKLLKGFDISPVPIRLYQVDTKQQRGYWRIAFEGAWDMYL